MQGHEHKVGGCARSRRRCDLGMKLHAFAKSSSMSSVRCRKHVCIDMKWWHHPRDCWKKGLSYDWNCNHHVCKLSFGCIGSDEEHRATSGIIIQHTQYEKVEDVNFQFSMD
mmetsp:Transcript_12686/g.19503  ORF Transcript_12686/g.19503 Transcript_12686/m.19503 type:complete len:111 (-) Transcript_12686:5731-6063(-)